MNLRPGDPTKRVQLLGAPVAYGPQSQHRALGWLRATFLTRKGVLDRFTALSAASSGALGMDRSSLSPS
ncbi:hypothetical protein [Haloarcula sp. JP-L23]|uniref:hypothetical protein n=1 Tax=Haloarcula sp. JP-L23 TaxID=2716717 RepID=UPI00140EDB4E|nr:hypothetical protein G9465_08400 [Haloarcula sp. JP-L23]